MARPEYLVLQRGAWILPLRWLSLSGAATQEPGFDPTGAAMPNGEGCQPQIIVTVPDFPEAEHVSASTVVVDFGESRICTQSADDPATFRQWLQKQRDFWFPGEQTPSNGAAP